MMNQNSKLSDNVTIVHCFLALTVFAALSMSFCSRRAYIETIVQTPTVWKNDVIATNTRKTYSKEETQNVHDLKEIEKIKFYESIKIIVFSAFKIDICARLANSTVTNNMFTPLGACNTFSKIHIIGWEHKDYQNQTVKCSYLWETNNISEYLSPRRYHFSVDDNVYLQCTHYFCRTDRRDVALRGVLVQVGNSSCTSVTERYVQPMQQRIPITSGMIAVCLKVLYGNVDALWLVEWLEYYKEMRVDTVFLRLHKDASVNMSRVVQVYVTEGFVKMLPYDIPLTRDIVRTPDQKNLQSWNDEQVVVEDFSFRYSEYTYTLIIDLDEFLAPADGNIKYLLSRFMETYPTGAGFRLESTLLIKSWGTASMYGSSVVSQYTQGTNTKFTRQKYISVKDRISVGRTTHFFRSRRGFSEIDVPVKLALVYHYKDGYYGNEHDLCDGARYNRTRILEIIKKIEPSCLAVKQKLLLI